MSRLVNEDFFSILGTTFLFECTINATEIADNGSTWSFSCYRQRRHHHHHHHHHHRRRRRRRRHHLLSVGMGPVSNITGKKVS